MIQTEFTEPISEFQTPLVSIILLAFNHLEYTKLCVESLYRFTSHIHFELITVNNGSSDDTQQFFDTLPNHKKMNYSDNVGGDTAINAGLQLAEGKYTVFLSNDLVLTAHWLDNLLTCIESDETIGIVVPACSASSNYQQVNLNYNNMAEMAQTAAFYNTSNHGKWDERVRLITYTFLIKTELFKQLGGLEEIYNPGGFDDDDLSFRVRRAGYKLIYAKDTFVHHFGSITIQSDYEKLNLLERNRRIFSSKFGVDAWDDCMIDFEFVNIIQCGPKQHKDILVLCASCGGTILQVKNKFRENDIVDVTLWTMTENQRYVQDLKSISDFTVCDRFANITDIYKDKLFDYILIEIDLQGIAAHKALLQDITKILRDNGQLIFAAANEAFYLNLINLLNGNVDCDDNMSRCGFNVEKLCNFISNQGFANPQIGHSKVPVPLEHRPLFDNLKKTSLVQDKDLLEEIYATKRVVFSLQGKTKCKNILLYPGYDFWLNDVIFHDNNVGNFLGVDTGQNMLAVLRDECSKRNFKLSTIDRGNIEQSEYIVFCDVPKSFQNPIFRMMYHQVYRGDSFFKEWMAGSQKSKMVFILMEPPFVMPENYNRSFEQYASIIFTYLDDVVDNKKYFKYFYPQPLLISNPYQVSYADKQLYALIASNKFSNVTGELYSERKNAIEYFENNLKDGFDLYGSGWEATGYRCYKGQSPGKLATLSKYKYCICYENGSANGYITEKIFDCFFAGCVPIYLGAPNITDYIPANTFIDRRIFVSYEEMNSYVNSMDENQYNIYLANIRQFLSSDAFHQFTYAHFAQTIVQVLEKTLNNR